jgi:hypothetical protein
LATFPASARSIGYPEQLAASSLPFEFDRAFFAAAIGLLPSSRLNDQESRVLETFDFPHRSNHLS